MKRTLAIALCSLSLGLVSQSSIASSATTSAAPSADSTAGSEPAEHTHAAWCKAHPEKCQKMKELREERSQWKTEKREKWCKDNPEKCEKWKAKLQEKQSSPSSSSSSISH